MSEVRAASGVPAASAFSGLGAPTQCAPVLVDSDTGYVYTLKTGDAVVQAGAGGTVTSVGLSAPSSTLTVSGSPVTTSGTLALAWNVTQGDTLYASGSNTMAKLAIGTSGRFLQSSGTLPQWTAPAALTKTDDTNVTLTLGGTPATALMQPASITVGWSGTLTVARGGTGQGTKTPALMDSSLTTGRITFSTTSGFLTDSANLTYDGTNLALVGPFNFSRGAASVGIFNSTAADGGYYEFQRSGTTRGYFGSAKAIGIAGGPTNNDVGIFAGADLWFEGVVVHLSGTVQFGTHSAVGVETITGFITVNDAGGTPRKLAVLS